jgi:hypothetical protein
MPPARPPFVFVSARFSHSVPFDEVGIANASNQVRGKEQQMFSFGKKMLAVLAVGAAFIAGSEAQAHFPVRRVCHPVVVRRPVCHPVVVRPVVCAPVYRPVYRPVVIVRPAFVPVSDAPDAPAAPEVPE